MSEKRISFLSTKKHGMTIDMYLVKEYLRKAMPDVSFRYLINSENSGNYMIKRSFKEKKTEFYKEMESVICVDASLNGEIVNNQNESKKILLAVPYNDFFKEVKNRDIFKNFTHIIATSPYVLNRINECYDVQNAKIIGDIATPLSWLLGQKAICGQIREEVEVVFPAAKGKKIIFILCVGKISSANKEFWQEFDLKEYIDNLGEECFVFTNNKGLLDKASLMESKYMKSFGCVNDIFPLWKILAISDVLYSNNGEMMCKYAATGKPLYCLLRNNNAFEKYMLVNYAEMCVTPNQMVNVETEKIMDACGKFIDEFSYGTDRNPCESIKKILD